MYFPQVVLGAKRSGLEEIDVIIRYLDMAGIINSLKGAWGFGSNSNSTPVASMNGSMNAANRKNGLAPNKPVNMRALMNSTSTGANTASTNSNNSKMAALAPPTGGARGKRRGTKRVKGRKGTKRRARK